MVAKNQADELLRKYWLDFLALTGIATVNALVYYALPQDLQLELMLNRQSPELLSWWTHAYVHKGPNHLHGNLKTYALTALPAWALYAYEGNRKRFWITTTVFVTLGPLVTAGASDLVYSAAGWTIQYSMGFSAVACAFGGFLLGSTLTEIELTQPQPLARTTAGYLMTVLLVAMAVILSDPYLSLLFRITGVLSLASLAYWTNSGYFATTTELVHWTKENPAPALLILIGGCLGAGSVLSAFPNTLIHGGALVDFAGHGAGLLFGLASSYAGRP